MVTPEQHARVLRLVAESTRAQHAHLAGMTHFSPAQAFGPEGWATRDTVDRVAQAVRALNDPELADVLASVEFMRDTFDRLALEHGFPRPVA